MDTNWTRIATQKAFYGKAIYNQVFLCPPYITINFTLGIIYVCTNCFKCPIELVWGRLMGTITFFACFMCILMP